MKILRTGNIYKVYDDTMQTMDTLPPNTFRVGFHKLSGFFLEPVSDLTLTETMFGCRADNVEMVLDSYEDYVSEFGSSMGVILSGKKGIGKSMFAKAVCTAAQKRGYPIIIITKPYTGIVEFIGSIEQNVVVLFDEFDKTFKAFNDDDGDTTQADLLTMFDGTTGDKKLFIVTCNDVYDVNGCMINRPGRFHYHFRFSHLASGEIRDYMVAKLNQLYHNTDGTLNDAGEQAVSDVLSLSTHVRLNYDCMRAIVFELNHGIPLSKFIDNLNIISYDDISYEVEVGFDNGLTAYGEIECRDIFAVHNFHLGVSTTPESDHSGLTVCTLKFVQKKGTLIPNYGHGDVRVDLEKTKVEVYGMRDELLKPDNKLTYIIMRPADNDLYRYVI